MGYSKDSKLEDEITNIYATTLVTAFGEYKTLQQTIQTWIRAVEAGESVLSSTTESDDLVEFREKMHGYHKQRLEEYRNSRRGPLPGQGGGLQNSRAQSGAGEADDASDGSVSEVTLGSLDAEEFDDPDKFPRMVAKRAPLVAPLPPNDMRAYKPTILGLDQACRDCLTEMAKTAREIDALTDDPTIAADPTRHSLYLSPAVFRQLLPHVDNAERKAAKDEVEGAREETRSELRALRGAVGNELVELAATNAALRHTVDELSQRISALAEASTKLSLGVTFRQYNGYCPAPLGRPVEFHSAHTKAVMDYHHEYDKFHMWKQYGGVHQAFVVLPGRIGYFIRYAALQRFVAVGDMGDTGKIYLTVKEAGSEFTFKANDDGTCMIFLAEPKHYSMDPEGARTANGTRLVLWPHGTNQNSRWWLKCRGE